MGFVINNNLAANNSYRNLNNTQNDLSKSLEKLSTGLRINRAARRRSRPVHLRGPEVPGHRLGAGRPQRPGRHLVIQTAEGALTEVHSILQRVRDLAVQAATTRTTLTPARPSRPKSTRSAAELTRIGDVDQLQRHQACSTGRRGTAAR